MIITLVLIVIGTILVLYRLPDLIRSPRRPAMWSLWAGMIGLTLSLAIGLPMVLDLSLASRYLVQHLLILGALWGFELFFWFSIYPAGKPRPSVWRYCGPLVAFLVLMTVAFVVTEIVENPDFSDVNYQSQPWATVTVLAYSGGFAAAMFTIAQLSWRYSRTADKRWVRRGLGTMTVGSWVALVYGVHHFGYIILLTQGINPYHQAQVELYPIVIGVLLILLGVSMPAFGPVISALYRWIRHVLVWWNLRPLWRAFYQAMPYIQLPAPLPMRDMEGAVRRRVVEIWDGRSRVRIYMQPEIRIRALEAGRALGLDGDELAAVVEAEVWRDALARLARGEQPGHADIVIAPEAGDTLPASVAWLKRVARAMKQPPLLTP